MKKRSVKHVSPQAPVVEYWQHGVIWHGVDEIEIELGEAHWYGQGTLINQHWPLEKIAQYPAPFLTTDNGTTGLSGILHPFWWTSTGVGILVSGDELCTSFNAPLEGKPPNHSFQHPAPQHIRPQLAETIKTDGLLKIQGKNLTIRFFEMANAREVVEAFWELIAVTVPPPAHYFEKPLWTTWAQFKNNLSHDVVMAYVKKVQTYGFPIGTLGIDAMWQDFFGNTRFDLQKFPNPKATVDALHQYGIHVTLWCIPFYTTTSEHFHTAIEKGYAIKQADGIPFITAWWDEGDIVLLDVTNPDAATWHLDNLQQLADETGVDGFKFDAGEGWFYSNPDLVFHEKMPPNGVNQCYIEQAAKRFAWSDVRSGWRSQHQPMLFRQWDKSTLWGHDNGLASVIPQAMTLNLLGYPYSFPDMIGGNKYGELQEQTLNAELLIRWTQAVAPMPIIQFSLAPWEQGEECAAICARYARLHGELAPRNMQVKGPIVRPLWWVAPYDEAALVCDDQYLIGDDLLVAPVLKQGAVSRHIYLPEGQWRSYWDKNETHQGGQWLEDYPAPLDVLPLFERV